MGSSLTKAQGDLGTVKESAEAFAEAMPGAVESHLETIDKASSEIENAASKTEENFQLAARAVNDLAHTHAEAIRTICESVGKATEEIRSRSANCMSEAK